MAHPNYYTQKNPQVSLKVLVGVAGFEPAAFPIFNRDAISDLILTYYQVKNNPPKSSITFKYKC